MQIPVPREGIHAALWIPTDARGRLMKRALAVHLRFLRERGVHGVLALGSTGEFPRFSLEARKSVLAAIADLAAPLAVIANISDIRPQAVVELGRYARKLGLPAVAMMPPSFFPMSQADMLEFFLRTAETVKLPVFLYNFPELTSNRISLETIAAFADRAPMAGIKQSGGEFSYHQQLIRLGREKNFVVFSGADTRLPEVFALGAAGCIGGLVNIVPELMVEIFNLCKGPNPGNPVQVANKMKQVGAVIDRLTFPLNVAAGIEARGLTPGAPKTIVSDESARLYREIITDLRSLFRSWDLDLCSENSRPSARRAA
jgi:dihydrodipicolinate synthase/N-acetylneuraminate lyase